MFRTVDKPGNIEYGEGNYWSTGSNPVLYTFGTALIFLFFGACTTNSEVVNYYRSNRTETFDLVDEFRKLEETTNWNFKIQKLTDSNYYVSIYPLNSKMEFSKIYFYTATDSIQKNFNAIPSVVQALKSNEHYLRVISLLKKTRFNGISNSFTRDNGIFLAWNSNGGYVKGLIFLKEEKEEKEGNRFGPNVEENVYIYNDNP